MTNEQEYETLKDMFLTDGWKLFISYLEQDAAVLSNCRYLKDEKELYYTRGKLAILDDLINFESKLDAAQEEQVEASEGF
jgi:hypothetical protein